MSQKSEIQLFTDLTVRIFFLKKLKNYTKIKISNIKNKI